MNRQQYDYHIHFFQMDPTNLDKDRVDWVEDMKGWEATLKEYGAEGYDLASTILTDPSNLFLIFKRPVQQ